MTAGPRWFRRLTIRWRLMTIGLVGLAVALAAAGTLLYAVLSATLTRTLASEASAAAREVAGFTTVTSCPRTAINASSRVPNDCPLCWIVNGPPPCAAAGTLRVSATRGRNLRMDDSFVASTPARTQAEETSRKEG